MMKSYSRTSALLTLLLAACSVNTLNDEVSQKAYIAVEGGNRIAVLDAKTRMVINTIDLTEKVNGTTHEFSPHNVQVAPDGMSVWVTANYGQMQHDEGGGHGANIRSDVARDQVIIIDPNTDTITKRIPIALGARLAHVVVAKDSSFSYATSQEKGIVYKIDIKNFTVVKGIAAPAGSEPHGLRISPDGLTAYIALLAGKGLGILDLRTDTLSLLPLEGNAVQTGVTPDGKLVVVTLYDTKKLAVYDVASKKLEYIALPQSAKGPVQMYPTPDSRFVYIADQGYYFGQPIGDHVYKIDLRTKNFIKEIAVGDAPHGVVVSADGKFVYVTNLLSKDVSIIDTSTDVEVKRVNVGELPNGISLWSGIPSVAHK